MITVEQLKTIITRMEKQPDVEKADIIFDEFLKRYHAKYRAGWAILNKLEYQEVRYDLERCNDKDEQLKIANAWLKKYNRRPFVCEHIEIKSNSICLWPKWNPNDSGQEQLND